MNYRPIKIEFNFTKERDLVIDKIHENLQFGMTTREFLEYCIVEIVECIN
jgi:hypothetical protein